MHIFIHIYAQAFTVRDTNKEINTNTYTLGSVCVCVCVHNSRYRQPTHLFSGFLYRYIVHGKQTYAVPLRKIAPRPPPHVRKLADSEAINNDLLANNESNKHTV